MSSSSVCQGLQSCLEPRVIEPRVLSLKLAPPNFSQPSASAITKTNTVSSPSNSEKPLINNECDTKDTIPNVGGWSFLQSLSHCNNKTEEQVYVHPTVKRSSSMLSEKSLEMCTESLGSETGSNAGESSDEISLFYFDTSNTTTLNTNCESKRVNRACNFPPPLTSITDLGGVHVMPRREGGRLILEAVASPSPRPYFHAERGDGRLRLSLFESFSVSDGEEEVGDSEEGVDEEDEGENEKKKEEGEGCGEEDNGVEDELEECVENVEGEMGVKKFARPRSRCKQSGNRDIFGDGLANLSFPLFLSVSE
ncbi:protein FANTASTIC FOUR 2-like [Abrus precatorius]|uniref:Protein FANTASTIC FOUR 2-like n=1 Tax=Abrus precatorius TaxID=3816 RepID=A0A8B8L4C5_ABRPR|nr:protein FANTASTIC FOUR 2-like [Abrus precatorius]